MSEPPRQRRNLTIFKMVESAAAPLLALGWPAEVAHSVAIVAVHGIAREMGGDTRYWPKPDALERDLRNESICAQYNGTNLRVLKTQYQLEERQIYSILQRSKSMED